MNGGNGNLAKTIVAHLCAIGVGGYFIYAAYEKIIDPRQFAVDIGNYKIAPEMFWNLMALFMPWWEVGGAVALIIPKTRRAGAIIVAGLLAVFIIAVAYAGLYLGLNIKCGCTGSDSSQAGWLTIGRNVLLLAMTAAAVYLPSWKRVSAAAPVISLLASDR